MNASLWRRRRRRHTGIEATAGAAPPTPDAVEVTSRSLGLAGQVCRTFVVTGYPREVGPGWLEPLVTYPGRVDVSVHVEPVPPSTAAQRLRRQLARLESDRRSSAEHGKLADPEVDIAAHDARDLAERLARGEGKLFRVALVVTVHAGDDEQLDTEAERVRSLASSLLLDTHPATFRMLHGWVTASLPLGVDLLGTRRSFDTQALAAAFPFASADVPHSGGGVLYGLNVNSAGLVVWDQFACDNYNSVVLARSGAGKSYFTKLEALRSLYTGVEVCVVDPEDEYRRLAEAVGGAHIRLGAEQVRLNPLDLPPQAAQSADALTRRTLFLHTLVSVLAGRELPAGARAALDRALVATYEQAGITNDPRTWNRPAPLLGDLARTLEVDGDGDALELARQLEPYTHGSHRGLFDGPTTTHPDGHLIVFSLAELPEELKAAGTLLVLDALWRRVQHPGQRRRRLVVVDEAWLLMQEAHGARFLFKLAKAARKYWAALMVVTQDAADLLGSELGQAVVANASTQVLLRQSPQAIDAITEAFGLSEGERSFLLAASRGEGLLAAGAHRAAFRAVASPAEHRLVTTDPAELAELDERDDP